MKTPRQPCGWVSNWLILSIAAIVLGGPTVHAQENGSQNTSSVLGSALLVTRTRGIPTVAIVTSSTQPGSARLWNEFYNGQWARTTRGLVQIVNVSNDAEHAIVEWLGATRFPTVFVYARGARGLTRVDTITDCDNAEALANRLRTLDLGLDPPRKLDPAVATTAYGGDTYPSSQASAPTPTYCPPPTTLSQPTPTTLTLTPTMAQPVTTTAGVVQMPSQNLMIQQAPPQVFLAPTQAPIVYVPQMSAAPAPTTLSLAPAPVYATPTANLFMSAPNLSVAPAPQATACLTAAPTLSLAPAPQPTATVAVASGPPTLAAVTNQTLSLPTTSYRTRIHVHGPGIFASSLARFGERLTRLGRVRIATVQETTLEAPLTQSPGVGMTTVSTSSATPIGQPPTTTLTPVQQPQQPCQTPPQSPPPTLPSPQRQFGRGN